MTTTSRNVLAAVSIVILTLSAIACGGRRATAVLVPPVVPGQGWIPLPFPDSKYEPGSVIAVDQSGAPRWVGHIRSCKVPEDLLKVVAGNIGDMTAAVKDKYGAQAVLKIRGIEAGPEWSRVKETKFVQNDQSAPALDLIAIRLWLTDPTNVAHFPDECTTILGEPSIYLVQEAFKVGSGKYTLTDTNNAKIAVTGLQLGPVKIDPKADAAFDTNGDLVMKVPVYTAVRRVRQISKGKFVTMGPGNAGGFDDATLLKELKIPTVPQ